MSYVGRLFFRRDTGHLLYWYEYETIGNAIIPTIEQDLNSIKPLTDYTPESIIVIELDSEDTLTREKVRRAKGIRYDLETGQLVFDIEPGVLKDIERRVLLEQRISELELIVNDITTKLSQQPSLEAKTSELEQVLADIAEVLLQKGVI